MQNSFSFHTPVKVHCGSGAIQTLPNLIDDRSVVLLSHPNSDAAGTRRALETLIGHRLVASLKHADGLPTLDEATRLCRSIWLAIDEVSRDSPDSSPSVLVAFGGGATIDLAKAVCHRTQDRRTIELEAWIRGASARPVFDPIELIAVPTTAGTGSEVTCWATLWDLNADGESTDHGIKRSLESDAAFPRIAIVDGDVTLTCPPSVTRDSGLDALAHALESIWNHHANPISDALAVESARRIIKILPAVLAEPQSTTLRQKMSEAALMAGLAFSQTRTALAHALSYPLTIEQGIPHGLACAVWLPTTWALATGRDQQRDRLLRSVFGQATDPLAKLESWLAELDVPSIADLVPDAERNARISAALEHPRGKNFIGAQ